MAALAAPDLVTTELVAARHPCLGSPRRLVVAMRWIAAVVAAPLVRAGRGGLQW